MKRILVLGTRTPFIYGGAEFLMESLTKKLKEIGYIADLLTIPETWDYRNILKHYFIAKLINFEEAIYRADLVIASKFPTYHVNHPNKVVWFLHHFRPFYEQWNTPLFPVSENNQELKTLRKLVLKVDSEALKQAKKVFAQSKTVAQRLKKFNNFEAEILYPPIEDSSQFFCESFEDYIIYPSRLSFSKRQHLAIETMAFVKTPVKLIIVGPPDTEEYLSQLKSLIKKMNLTSKVEILGKVERKRLIELYAYALGVLFLPVNEDYGFITIEAFLSQKPVITCVDSGGPLEFVENEYNGFVVEPDAKTIASAIDKLYSDKIFAKLLGKRGYDKIISQNISWDKVLEKLVSF